jgi:formylglycine-generating enzyme required for sulfatase activity
MVGQGPPARQVSPWRNALAAATLAGTLAATVGAVVYLMLFNHDGEADGLTPGPGPSGSIAPPGPTSVAPVLPVAPPSCPSGMLPIPGGKFFMGSDDADSLPFERPAHKVLLSPYCIDRFEVTVEQYRACSERSECKAAGTTNEDWKPELTPKQRAAYDPVCNAGDPVARAKHPINCVDWGMADAYCRARSARLPTEAEWEFAARGPDGRRYPWGDDAPTARRVNACGPECSAWGKAHGVAGETSPSMYKDDDGFATTAPVGSFPAGKSRYGVEDVVGNVWEWVADWYGPYEGGAEASDPKGPETGERRVARGGAWNGIRAPWVRPTFRLRARPTMKSHGFGFRCARSLG